MFLLYLFGTFHIVKFKQKNFRAKPELQEQIRSIFSQTRIFSRKLTT